MPLRNRQVMLPNGFKFIQPETQFQPERYSSFESCVNQIISHRLGNPHLIQKNGWSVDPAEVATELDNYNTRFCQQMQGDYLNYITEGGANVQAPFPQAGHQLGQFDKLRAVAVGAKILISWISDGSEAVPVEQASQRASVCAGVNPDGSDKCPMNNLGDWASFFTAPVAKAIHAELERKKNMNLATRFDGKLGTCDGCQCVMRLKVWVPINFIAKEMAEETKAYLDARCWVLKEMQQQTKPNG